MLGKRCLINVKRYCCEDISLIENYNEAISNFEKYDCHHRLEIQDDKLLSVKELKLQNLYYNRPASELIFLTHSEHAKLHSKNKPQYVLDAISKSNKGKHLTEEAKRMISEALKGCNNGMFGKNPWNKNKTGVYSKESLRRMSESRRGEKNIHYGTHYYNNGEIELRAKKCPDGFIRGRLKSSLLNLKQYQKNENH